MSSFNFSFAHFIKVSGLMTRLEKQFKNLAGVEKKMATKNRIFRTRLT